MPDLMGDKDIAFPHLGIYLTNIPEGFSVFGFHIALYGVIIACGMLLAVSLTARIAEKEGMKADDIWGLSIWLIFFSVIGARIYYVIFSWDMYKDNPLQVFNLRAGGLAIYGGVIAGFVTMAVYTRIKGLPYLKIVDAIMYGLLLGQIIGRYGNFTNREAFGEYTDTLFAMRIPVAAVRDIGAITPLMEAHMTEGVNYIQVHPTFLYESLWNLMLLVLLLIYRTHKRFDGEIILLYLGGYGIGRFWIESLRTDQLQIGGSGIAVSQMLGLILFAGALCAELYFRRKHADLS